MIISFFIFSYESQTFDRLYPIIFPLTGISMTGSIYICVAISVERYLGICRSDIQIRGKFRFYLLAILLITVIIEGPKFFEVEWNHTVKGYVLQ